MVTNICRIVIANCETRSRKLSIDPGLLRKLAMTKLVTPSLRGTKQSRLCRARMEWLPCVNCKLHGSMASCDRLTGGGFKPVNAAGYGNGIGRERFIKKAVITVRCEYGRCAVLSLLK